MPEAIAAYRLAPELPTMRTVEVEQFCSWSAWRMSRVLSAFSSTGETGYSSVGTANIMWRKLPQYLSSFRGYMNGWPMLFLYENAAIVRTFDINRVMWSSAGELRSRQSG